MIKLLFNDLRTNSSIAMGTEVRDFVCLIVVKRKEHQCSDRQQYHHEQDHETYVPMSGGVENVLLHDKSRSNLTALHAFDLHRIQRDFHDHFLGFLFALIHVHDIGIQIRVMDGLPGDRHQLRSLRRVSEFGSEIGKVEGLQIVVVSRLDERISFRRKGFVRGSLSHQRSNISLRRLEKELIGGRFVKRVFLNFVRMSLSKESGLFLAIHGLLWRSIYLGTLGYFEEVPRRRFPLGIGRLLSIVVF